MKGTSIINNYLKYELYEQSVQCAENDVEFVKYQFEKINNRSAISLREDFAGTAALACAWTQIDTGHLAYAIDLDEEPWQAYGKDTHFAPLNASQQSNLKYIQGNVLDNYTFKVDITTAFNFSYFIFKKREELVKYFQGVYKTLNDDGIFFLDIFGGTEAYSPLVEETEFEKHSYYWDCDMYNPLTSECMYYIHFKTLDDNIKYEKVFAYDWRMWTPREIEEIMLEVGFSRVILYWEGDDEEGAGNGEFHESRNEENCESWVTYIAACKKIA